MRTLKVCDSHAISVTVERVQRLRVLSGWIGGGGGGVIEGRTLRLSSFLWLERDISRELQKSKDEIQAVKKSRQVQEMGEESVAYQKTECQEEAECMPEVARREKSCAGCASSPVKDVKRWYDVSNQKYC